MAADVLRELFAPAAAAWFEAEHGAPTPVQAQGWPAIAAGRSVLLCAPTGSGKTLAAFFAAVDRLRRESAAAGVDVVYVSPLRALGNDIRRNLETVVRALGGVSVGVRTGDTPQAERRAQLRRPPRILITTPESLFILLASSSGRAALRTARTAIVDEMHALIGTKRGAHLALSLERLEALTAVGLQRIGLSATVRPLEEAAAFLGGGRPVSVVDVAAPRAVDLRVLTPVDDFEQVPGDSIWDSIVPQVLEMIRAHRTTLVFVGNRGLCERLTARLNAAAGESVCRSHHGSASRELREAVEADLKAGRLRAVCATGTLEFGLDIGTVDLVVQVESPHGVARGLQRIGRSGHRVGGTPRGRIVAKHPADLLEAAVTAQAMRRGAIEPVRAPEAPLDVLAQQAVALACGGAVPVADVLALCRRAHPYRHLTRDALEAALRLVSDASLGPPRLDWDRAADTLTARPGALSLVVRAGGTIPDRGLFPAIHDGRRVGELDEEFVYESRVGDTFVLGSTSWRLDAVRADRVLVSPGTGGLPRLPFWHGEGLGRPVGLGLRVGAFLREAEARRWAGSAAGGGEAGAPAAGPVAGPEEDPGADPVADSAAGLDADPAAGPPAMEAWLRHEHDCDPAAARCLAAHLARQPVLPTDRRVVCESFPDPLGEGLLVVHSVFGARVNAPWAMALGAALGARAVYTDDGMLLRLPPERAAGVLRRFTFPQLRAVLERDLPRTPLFAALFRENAARALVLPRLGPGRRTPLWLQRLRAGDLLARALVEPDHPLVAETRRQCLEDVFDLGAWERAMACEVVERRLPGPSPLAHGLLMQFQARFLYEADAPGAERAEADLVAGGAAAPDPEALRHAAARALGQARSAVELADLLRRSGGLTGEEVGALSTVPPEALGPRVRREGGLWVLADEPAPGPDRVARHLRTSAPVGAASVARRFGLPEPEAAAILGALAAQGRAVPVGGAFAAPEVLRAAHRRTLARLRAQAAPRAPGEHAAWVDGLLRGSLADVLDRLQGHALSAAAWEEHVLPRRVPGYRPEDLDHLLATGAFVAAGARPAFYRRELAERLLPAAPAQGPVAEELRARGALFFSDVCRHTGLGADEALAELRRLLAAGAAGNDSFGPWRGRPRSAGRAGAQLGARWFLLPAAPGGPEPAAWAEVLLRRYGVVSRAVWERAAPPVAWSAALAALRSAERAGRVLRGYFVRGLGGLQFALPEAVEAMRGVPAPPWWWLPACDPAHLWAGGPRRREGEFMVLAGPEPVLAVAGGRVTALRPLGPDDRRAAARCLRELPGSRGRLSVIWPDGEDALEAAGFERRPWGWVVYR